jgi:hypothetical protein
MRVGLAFGVPEGSLAGFFWAAFWRVVAPRGPGQPQKMWGASPPPFLKAFPGPRGRPDLKNAPNLERVFSQCGLGSSARYTYPCGSLVFSRSRPRSLDQRCRSCRYGHATTTGRYGHARGFRRGVAEKASGRLAGGVREHKVIHLAQPWLSERIFLRCPAVILRTTLGE